MPQKQAMGNMEDHLIEKRKYILDQFLKGLCEYDYLASTPEV